MNLQRVSICTILTAILFALALFVTGCSEAPPAPAVAVEPTWPQVEGYGAMPVPADNPLTAEKVSLGKQLYYDARLSGDGVRSCYGCDLKEHGLTDGKPLAIGAFDNTLTRSSPTMWSVGYYPALYWDGRSGALEKQVQGAWSGGKANRWLDETNLADAKNANLTDQDKSDIVAFLKALDVENRFQSRPCQSAGSRTVITNNQSEEDHV